MIYKTLFTIFFSVLLTIGCRPGFEHRITIEELQETLEFLASDSLKGRFPGSPEDSVLSQYIVGRLEQSGMVMLDSNGIQSVHAERGHTVTSNNRFLIGEKRGAIIEGVNLKVLGFSSTDTIHGEILLASKLPDKEMTDLDEGILVLPLPEALPSNEYDLYAFLRSQGLAAADRGAGAVVFIYKDRFSLPANSKKQTLHIPVIAIPFQQLAGLSGFFSLELFTAIAESEMHTVISTGIHATIETEVIANEIETFNTIAGLKGSDPGLSDQYILIGAHHDHLGMGGRGSSSRRQDTIAVHYGADDNASGVAGVIELSQHLMSRSPSRSFVFATFAAEEMGLYGSKKLAEDPPVPIEDLSVMINLDMIGRLNQDRQLQIGGIGTSPLFRPLIDSLNSSFQFNIAYSEAGYGPSDHSSFYAKDVPVLFISTGAHTDYHTPEDNIEKINYEGMQEVLYFISDIAFHISTYPDKIPFREAGPKKSSGSRGREGMVTFGLMPDVMYDGNNGMPVSFVTEGKPAAIGGMKSGDRIIKIDGKPVGNVHDYMERLSALKEDQSVIVTVQRNEEIIELLIQL
jgi:aminopeptidase YwaD